MRCRCQGQAKPLVPDAHALASPRSSPDPYALRPLHADMLSDRRVSPLAIDLTRMHRRTVTSFYSNLVTRPTGRAIRMGVESQIAELEPERELCVSVLDFAQVRVLDYSCADEIVAKLLLRYARDDRPGDTYFVVRGMQEHHEEAIEAVLERHRLLLAAETAAGASRLLGPSDAVQRACWAMLVAHGRASVAQVAGHTGLAPEAVAPTLAALVVQRVVVPLSQGGFCALPTLAAHAHGES